MNALVKKERRDDRTKKENPQTSIIAKKNTNLCYSVSPLKSVKG